MRDPSHKPSLRKPQIKRPGRAFHVKATLILLVFFLAASLVISGFYQLQIRDQEALAARAANQQYTTQTQLTRRGMILDRDGYPLVFSSYVYRVGITPGDVYTKIKGIEDTDIVDQLAFYLGLDEEACQAILDSIRTDRATGWAGLEKKLSGHQRLTYLTVATDVAETQAKALEEWLIQNRVGGVRFDPEERRVYNNESLGSSVLGLTRNQEGKISGVSGLEAAYNDLLSGEAGYLYAKRNNYTTKGVTPFSKPVERPAEGSRNLVTTLDMEVMAILQEELQSAGAAAGLISAVNGLVMEVKTGDVLAMGQLAAYDASDPTGLPLGFTAESWDSLPAEEKTAYRSANLWDNINITDIYEPGSVLKALTLAIAFEEGVASEKTLFEDDPLTIQGETITCHTGYGHGQETLREAFYRSCNPVFVQLANRVGKDLFYEWIQKLGLYGKTGIDLPMEASGYLHRDPMPIDFANLAFGESSSLTAIQMAQIFALIGNGGYLVTPRLGYASSGDGIENMQVFELQEAKALLSDQTCQRVRSLMADVVNVGTAANTFGAIGFELGGKTGTAVDSSDGQRTYTFIGLAPVDQPEYVILISIHKPQTSDALGSAAARAANRVAARLLNLTGRQQTYTSNELYRLGLPVEVPDLSGLTVGEAALALSRLHLAPALGEGSYFPDRRLARVTPAAGSKVGAGTTVWLYPEGVDEVEWVAVPDFSGCNYHESVWLAAEYGVSILPPAMPAGIVIEQSIPATSSRAPVLQNDETGSPCDADQYEDKIEGKVKRGTIIRLTFSSLAKEDGG